MSYVESREQDKQANNKNKFIVTENILIVVRLGCGDMDEVGKEVKERRRLGLQTGQPTHMCLLGAVGEV